MASQSLPEIPTTAQLLKYVIYHEKRTFSVQIDKK